VLSVTTVFIWIALVVVLYAFNSAPIIPMMDSTVMELLGEHKDRYGKLRLWGAVGWGLSAPLIGLLIKENGIQWSFWGYLIQMAVVFVVVMSLPAVPAWAAGSGRRIMAFCRMFAGACSSWWSLSVESLCFPFQLSVPQDE
jgi:PPP family 3-phenylpropionic acid transporter